LQHLAKIGFVSSIRGPKGGFKIKKNSDEIILIDIYEALEGTLDLEDCTFKCPLCTEKCMLRTLLRSTNDIFLKFFKETTLLDIINSNK
ncbi:MAG: Rrf2 family transcriptional regulator, partial [bacterium]